jgi:hypothetical protein
VLACAISLWDAGIIPIVIEDCCASTGGAEYHSMGIMLMHRMFGAGRRGGVEKIGQDKYWNKIKIATRQNLVQNKDCSEVKSATKQMLWLDKI